MEKVTIEGADLAKEIAKKVNEEFDKKKLPLNAIYVFGNESNGISESINKILDEMNTLVKKDGFSNISEAVGSKNFQFLMDETDRSIFG